MFERIKKMEAIYDRVRELLNKDTLNYMESVELNDGFKRLEEYYTSKDWKEDFAADEEGKLPKNLKRGVLSEDGIYNLLDRKYEKNIRTREDAVGYGLTFDDTYKDAPFHDDNWDLMRYKHNKKTFMLIYEKGGYININVKVDPEKALFWRDVYKSVIPGYHQNKEHWNTIILDGSIPDIDVRMMIAESYDIISDSPSKRIYEAVKRIPYGHVATYAQVAEAAGDRKMARAVGNALHKNPDPDNIPCYRVVNSKGELAAEFAFGGAIRQQKMLEAEGIEVINGKVDLDKYGWR